MKMIENIRLKMRSIDLNFCGDGYDEYIKEIKNKMENLT